MNIENIIERTFGNVLGNLENSWKGNQNNAELAANHLYSDRK